MYACMHVNVKTCKYLHVFVSIHCVLLLLLLQQLSRIFSWKQRHFSNNNITITNTHPFTIPKPNSHVCCCYCICKTYGSTVMYAVKYRNCTTFNNTVSHGVKDTKQKTKKKQKNAWKICSRKCKAMSITMLPVIYKIKQQ